MTRRTLAVAMAMIALASSCVIRTGRPPIEDALVTSPRGSEGGVRMPSTQQEFRGELLAVEDSAYVFLVTNRVSVFPFVAGMMAELPGKAWARGAPSAAKADEMRGYARFPYGIPAPALKAILERAGQEKPDTIRLRPPIDALDEARAGTARYRDADAATADGFKRVGVEFPNMGEHWVNLARVLANRFSPAEPSILTYVTVRGQRQLVGVAYTALLRAGETPPTIIAPASAWHEHNGSVAEESFPLHHAAGGRSADSDALRLSVLHAWIWTPNPAGPFETDNADLPFVRLGISPRTLSGGGTALNGISLALDNTGYYAMTIRTALHPTDDELRVLDRIIAMHRSRGATQLSKADSVDGHALSAVWNSLWVDLGRELPGRGPELRRLQSAFQLEREASRR